MSEIEQNNEHSLESLESLNLSDKVSYFIKSVSGALPFFGSLIAETLVTTIPNQKQDRIISFLKVLDKRLNELPNELVEKLHKNPEFVALLEESVEQSSRITTKERIEYLASIVVNGITDEEIELKESEYILSLFKQLNDIQIIWLKYYSLRFPAFQHGYFKKHENILRKRQVYLGSNTEEIKKAALQKSNSEHLVRLGLIKEELEIDRKTNQLVIDSSKKKPKVKDTEITTLGKTVLIHIDLYEDPKELLNKQKEK